MIDDPKTQTYNQDQNDTAETTTQDQTDQGTMEKGGAATYGEAGTEDEDMDIDLEEEEVGDLDLEETEEVEEE